MKFFDLLTIAFILFFSFKVHSEIIRSVENDSILIKPRYQYKPIQTQKFEINLKVISFFKVGGEIQKSVTHIHANARAIPYKVDSVEDIHFMSLLSEGFLKQNMNGTEDSSDLSIYTTKRIELIMNHSGVIKQIYDIEKLPPFPITGYANPDENGLRILLSSFFPRLPDSISSTLHPIISTQDSTITTYPDKTVKRLSQDKTTYKIISVSDSTTNFGFDSRFTATNIIYPQNISPAKVSEDQISTGSFVLSNEGKLLEYARTTTVYRSIQPMENPSSERIEETTTIHFTLKKI
jgi:hypothetical protein